jgi:AraC-like DNA-binding protein
MDTQNLLKCLHLSLLNLDDCNAQNWNFVKVTSPFARLYLVKNGSGSILHNHKKYELKPNHLYLIPSFTLCNYTSETFLEHFYIHFIPQMTCGTDVFKLLEFRYELIATASDFSLFERLLDLNPGRRLENLDPNRYSKNNFVPHELPMKSLQQIAVSLETQGILLQLFARFIKNEDQKMTSIYPNSKIRLAIEHIQAKLFKPVMLSELAGLCNLSNDYFSRLFLKTMGMRPIDYINRKRIEEAQLKLVTTNDPIEKIALELGLDNFSYFNRMFKKYSCTTPGEYRRMHSFV